VALKEANPKLRILLALGGWLAGGSQFSALVASDESMIEFVNNAITYLRRFGFDGVDIDWEYPGTPPDTKSNFTQLLRVRGTYLRT